MVRTWSRWASRISRAQVYLAICKETIELFCSIGLNQAYLLPGLKWAATMLETQWIHSRISMWNLPFWLKWSVFQQDCFNGLSEHEGYPQIPVLLVVSSLFERMPFEGYTFTQTNSLSRLVISVISHIVSEASPKVIRSHHSIPLSQQFLRG